MCRLAYLRAEDQPLVAQDIPIYKDDSNLPTELYRQKFHEICDRFFKNEGIIEYLGILADPSTRISRDELFVHLKSLHLLAFHEIMKTHIEHGLIQPASLEQLPNLTKQLKNFVEAWSKFNAESDNAHEKNKILFSVQKDLMVQLDLLSAYNTMRITYERQGIRGKMAYKLLE